MSSRILIVNNQPQLIGLISEKLKQLGHHVTTPVDSYVALELVSVGGFDLIILDDQMPLMGVEGFLESLDEAGVKAPVVLLSSSPDAVSDSGLLGVSEILSKPFQMDMLIQCVSGLVNRN